MVSSIEKCSINISDDSELLLSGRAKTEKYLNKFTQDLSSVKFLKELVLLMNYSRSQDSQQHIYFS